MKPQADRRRWAASYRRSPAPMFLADNGSPWFISGVPDSGWNNDDLHALTQLHGSDFEVVDESSLMADPNSGQVQ